MTHQTCVRCVMDSSDPSVSFDSDGICNYCTNYFSTKQYQWHRGSIGSKKLNTLISRLKKSGKGKPFDAILGLSGGVDSSYLALRSKAWGLRLLVVHIDAGWNSEVATSNIEKLVDYCGYELYTNVINWNEMRSLQLAYLRSGVMNQDIPQDHAYFASLYKFAVSNNINTIFSGGNIATEGIAPDFMYDPLDLTNLLSINSSYGTTPLKTFPKLSFFERYFLYPFYYKLKVVRPLNYLDYSKSDAVSELTRTVGWTDYGRKHGESHFTKFFQNYYLPHRYGFDKRRHHLSSLVVTNQISRADALLLLQQPLISSSELAQSIDYVCAKLQISSSELEHLVTLPDLPHLSLPNSRNRYRLLKISQKLFSLVLFRAFRPYS